MNYLLPNCYDKNEMFLEKAVFLESFRDINVYSV